uniref:PI31 proteasome regulator N-terminal domain-containing protein n=1 Tax=Brassica oleracea var. oleracea TaxID=109376 RepID=A0A0D3CZL8_BRAOL
MVLLGRTGSLLDPWGNEFDEYASVYAKGSKKFLVKCFAIEDKLLVDAVDEGGKEPAHIEIEFEKYAAESGVEGDYDAHFKNLGKLVTDLQDQILYKLDEGLKPVASTSQSRTLSSKHIGIVCRVY